jgi:stress-induced morphogen
MDSELIREKLLAFFPDAQLELRDLTGTKDHFELHISAPELHGQTRIKQHRLIYQALDGHVGGAIHALAIKTYTPEQWQERTSQ